MCLSCERRHKEDEECLQKEEEEQRERLSQKDCPFCSRTLLAVKMRYCTLCGQRACGPCSRTRKRHHCQGPVHDLPIKGD